MRNRVNKAFKIESHFDDNLIPVIRNFETAKKKKIKFKQGNGGDLRVIIHLPDKYHGPSKVTFLITE